ncbi:MAG: hypothetical protein AAF630_17960 [Cyanobacteria bacterium P01_C01_bin.38]
MANSPNKSLFRLLITPVRGGSGAFLRAFENNPNVHAVHQPIKSGLREKEIPDYSLYQSEHPIYNQYPGKFIVAKETIGPVKEQSTFNPFPNDHAIQESKPIFMFRDPFNTWNSWKKWWIKNPQIGLNWFCISYQHTYELLNNALKVSSEVSCITLEKLGKNPAEIFQHICSRWEIPYDARMLNWSIPFGENTTFTTDAKNLIDRHPAMIKSVEKVQESKTFSYHSLNLEELAIDSDEIEIITHKLLPSYQKVSQLSDTFYF